MKNTRKLKKYAKELYGRLEELFEKHAAEIDGNHKLVWIADNKNRILNIASSLYLEIPLCCLPEGSENLRVFELAQELVEQSNGIVNADTVEITRNFSLTFEEFDFLPMAIKLNLLRLIEKILQKPERFEKYASNTAKSLILFNEIDFTVLRDRCLVQQQLLLQDRGYMMSDEASRDRYRKAIAQLARSTEKSETEVIERLQSSSLGAAEQLFGTQRRFFAENIGAPVVQEHPAGRLAIYAAAVTLSTALVLFLLFFISAPLWCRILLAAASVAPLLTIFSNFLNRGILRRLKPCRPLQLKAEYADTPENKTAITLTVLLDSVKSANKALKTIEEYCAGNRIDNGVYVILADLKPAKEAEQDGDEALIERLVKGIAELNSRWGDKFSVIVRGREKSGKEYFGWERKRGALLQLVRYIREGEENFRIFEKKELLENVKYICTLDADTVLPPDCVKKLMGVIAHPANKLILKNGRYAGGFGLVQPGVGNAPGKQSIFAAAMAPAGGIDSYNYCSAELYKDFFKSGSFCGKGIFDVEGYDLLVSERIRPNTVLSHDILEGELLHTLVADDITVLDEFPQDPMTYFKRAERWVRGDWQLAGWLFSDLSAVSKWKIFYNLVQSLFAPGILLQAFAAPFFGVTGYLIWLGCIVELLIPVFFVYMDALRFDREKYEFSDGRQSRHNSLKRAFCAGIFLPFEAFNHVSAAGKALWRRIISHKKILQWTTFASSLGSKTVAGYYRFMMPSLVLAGIFYLVCLYCGIGIVSGLAVTALWMAAPYLAFISGQKVTKEQYRLLPDEVFSLKLLSMRTLRFFYEALADNGFLMPDNLQLKPYKGYAKRTSPTNIGFALLSACCGLKMGAYSPSLCAANLEKQIRAVSQLPKYKGHLYNWYDTDKKIPLTEYVSSVDSGNYCASLITVQAMLEQIKERWILGKSECSGIGDLLSSAVDEAEEDFKIHLTEYANAFYNSIGKRAAETARNFLNDGTLGSCEAAEYPAQLIRCWLADYDGLSFPQEIFEAIERTGEFNLKPLKDFLNSFPMPVKDILAVNENFEEKINSCVWSAGREKYAELIRQVKSAFRNIYQYAFAIEQKCAMIYRFTEQALDEIDFACLFNSEKKLLAIGINTRENKQSVNCYDMLCSEARLTSLTAIALGKIPAEHWFKLTRPFTRLYDLPLCLSWSGTMFEYLMPDIFIKPSENSMLYTSASIAVKAQEEFQSKSGIWGISESAFHAFDYSREYKYRAFGVPAIAVSTFKAEKIFSPYSCLLALEYAPQECMQNIVRLVEHGMTGSYGMYEAIDFKHCESNGGPGIVYSHMAHHAGMSLCALTNCLYSQALRKAFSSRSFIAAVSVLLEEKMPVGVLPRRQLPEEEKQVSYDTLELKREYMAPDKQAREVLLLDNGLMKLFASSDGYQQVFCGDVGLNSSCENGVSLYLKDEKLSSITYLPCADSSARYRAEFLPGTAEYQFDDFNTNARQSVFLSSGENAALWHVQITNKGEKPVEKTLAFISKVSLVPQESFDAHPYFNGLFMEMESFDGMLLAHNRKSGLWCGLTVLTEEQTIFATDALKVFGRGNDSDTPLLDFTDANKKNPITPCLAAQTTFRIGAGESAEAVFLLSFGKDAEQAVHALKQFKNKAAVTLARENAALNAGAMISASGLNREQWLFSLKLCALARSRMRVQAKVASRPDQLWKFGISDRKPLLTIFLEQDFTQNRFSDLMHIADYLFGKGLEIEILILEDTAQDYLDGSFHTVDTVINRFSVKETTHHIRLSQLEEGELESIKSLSFAFLNCSLELGEQLKRVNPPVKKQEVKIGQNEYPASRNHLIPGEFDCGYGRFINDGTEYYIYAQTPVPWSNIICNERFGFLCCENGGGYLWQGNSSMNKLTPWSNDVVYNRLGEVVYLRDNKLSRFWSITRAPIDNGDGYDCIYGHGYAVYRYGGFGMAQQQTVFVHKTLPVKVTMVECEDIRDRDIDAFYYCDPVLGSNKAESYKYLKAEELFGMLCIQRENGYFFIYSENAEYNSDRSAFFGGGNLKKPQAVQEGAFCAACEDEPVLSLRCRARSRFTVFCGYAADKGELARLAEILKDADPLLWLEDVKHEWEKRIRAIQIKTPERKLDILFNNWLCYQTMSSRLLSRCGFYQAGGAYGFRDQLQDCLALLISDPGVVRRHLLLCASHQFKEGDVQHWWHPPYAGVRTTVSDDLLFLPFVAAKYFDVTGEKQIFDEVVPYLEGHSLNGRHDLYENAWPSQESSSLYEHCMRAIRLVIKRSGKHNLPLILGGDWNDGMNGIGKEGKGESVWLGWFLYSVISRFLPVCRLYSEEDEQMLREHAKKLADALNTVCWDGQWYRRAFDDEGKIIGASDAECCRIDAISQAWAVLSGAGKPDKCKIALDSLERLLIDKENGIVKLLTPPFTKESGAGYIGEYVSGVRENGGQYTHGAIWTASAFAQIGEGDKCAEILDLINPISHTMTKAAAAKYMLEPYSVPADIYANEENKGRGGWSWYTASSAMYFTAVLHDMLGINVESGKVTVDPRIPSWWQEYSVEINTEHLSCCVKVLNPDGRSEGVRSLTAAEKEGVLASGSEIRVVM